MPFLGLHLVTSAKLAQLKADGHSLATAATSAITTAVAVAAQTGNPIGAAALKAVTTAESTTLTGAEKKAQAISIVKDVVIAEAAKGGVSAAIADAEQFAGMVVEEVVATMKQTPIVKLGLALLHALGLV
ncbi:hypothetical protein [Sphingomonas sp. CROZ-RG-20F-R02-07]|uniref:hypothetical protein n=1 Tax=Sphingomonas sp. CROZ-RG-20F-R02-07 TaxID=2914832 RepID=UPI001F55CBCD|nr:hypothetical protein [Sphingomonas sp. CROZ-RG-20F-R02-07]